MSEVDFTKERPTLKLDGHVFRTRAVNARKWGETLEAVGIAEQEKNDSGGIAIGVTADGFEQLIRLAIVPEQHDEWSELLQTTGVDFGQLTALYYWVWETMNARPFDPPPISSPGPGNGAVSSTEQSPSPEEAPTT